MSYNMKKMVFFVLLSLLLVKADGALAQGVVSLSEEAMFDDELETNKDFPAAGTKEAVAETKPSLVAAEPALEEKSPSEAIANKNVAEVGNNSGFENDVSAANRDISLDDIEKSPYPQANDTDELFSQMSNIEHNVALLNLWLRREKLQNEIAAIKNQRKQAQEQEKIKEEERALKKAEKEKELERKKIEEQQRLRELDIKFEQLRQERLLNAYKNQMLEENQKWIAHDAMFYKMINNAQTEKKNLITKHKEDLKNLQKEVESAYIAYQKKIEEHANEVRNLNSQIDVLRNRVSSMEQEAVNLRNSQNPFAQNNGDANLSAANDSVQSVSNSENVGTNNSEAVSTAVEPTVNSLAKYYAVTEIRGKNGELIAKLINKNGTAFYVKKGTALQSGHIISEITPTYVAADKNFKKDYIYFSAGGILPEETDVFEVEK